MPAFFTRKDIFANKKNDSECDIKNAVVAFVAWDKNKLPVKIKESTDFSDGAYIKQVNYNDINMIPGKTYGEISGYEIDDLCGIVTSHCCKLRNVYG